MQESIKYWERMAEWWDGKQGDEGDLWHRALIDPTLLRVLGPVSGQRALDLACGNGYLARRLARLGARVTGVDASEPIIAWAIEREARKPLGITYHAADAAHLDMLEADCFDVAICNMGLMDIEDAEGAIGETGRVLRPGGRFVASFSHPCFDVANSSAWVVEQANYTATVWRKVSRYRELFQGSIYWRMGVDQLWQTQVYHRPLSWYFRAFRAAGFVVAALEEPEPTQEFLQSDNEGSWIAQIPLHCVIEAWKTEINPFS